MSSGDSDAGPNHKRKRKVRILEDSPAGTSSSGSPIIGSSSSRARRRAFRSTKHNAEDSSDSDSDSISLIPRYIKRKKVGRVASDTDSDSSGSTIVKRTKRTGRIASDVDSDISDRGFEGSSSSQWETDISDAEGKAKPEVVSSPAARDDNIDSDSSDGQSEKCPICLLSFKQQEIGTPESCDHMFCLECIQEWSKNMNTCPVDRQEYNLILVRKNMDGKVARQIPVEKPSPQNDVDIVEDPTFCEICGTSDNEDRMLLCDGCDLGFHLYCLTPPLEDIPPGAWFCNECSPDDDYTSEIELYEIQLLLDDVEGMERPQGPRRNLSARLIPRTRQSERVRRRIANNRQQTSVNDSAPSQSSYIADRVSSSTSRVRRHKRSKKRRSPAVRYKTVYQIDEATGETIAMRKKQTKRGKAKKSKPRRANPVRLKTVKKRLASQLGICAPRAVPQNLPDVKVQNTVNTLGGMRWQAGIPTLHIFGRNNELDYFSGADDDYEGGSQLLTRRAPTRADASALRRVARRKAVISMPSAVSSSSDLLDSILSSQERFHSRNVSYSVDSDGRFKMEDKYVDVTNENAVNRQRPNYENQNSENNSSFNRLNSNNYHSYSLDAYHSTPTSTMDTAGTSSYSTGDRDHIEVPQDYTQRTLCASSEANQEKKDKDEETNSGTSTTNSESDFDIYSDIETVSTSRADESDPRPPSPPTLPNTPNMGTDFDDNNDSEPDMVIDDDKAQECEKTQEETTVTSTVGCSSEFSAAVVHSPKEMMDCSMEIQSGAIQSSNLMDNKNHDDEEDSTDGCPNASIYSKETINVLKDAEDVDSDDGCPNFSIYSKESKSVALHTDISLSAEDNTQTQQEYQVGEISSSPNVPNQEDFQPQSPQNRDENVNYAPEQKEEGAVTKSPDDQSDQAQNDAVKVFVSGGILGGLYSDSEDETVVKKDNGTFAISDINHMTEDISEEERSYTPCLDERANRQGLEGLETEMISDEDRNDFDESHELKTVSDGDALEINAKESELDFTRPEDYEEGEIVDKNKAAKIIEEKEPEKEKEKKKAKPKKDEEEGKEPKKPTKKKDKDKPPSSDHDKSGNKENEGHNRESSFKKLSKNNKERNYRDKDKETRQHSPSKPKENRELNKKERKRERRKELERYNVRAIIADKPRPQIVKDQFGRDVRRTPTRSRSASHTPPIHTSPSRPRTSLSKTRRSLSKRRSMSRMHKSVSKERSRKRRPRSRHRSMSRSRSRSPRKKRPGSKNKKRKRTPSRYDKRRKSVDRLKYKKKRSRSGRRSVTPRGKRGEWTRREWTPALSMSPSPEEHHMSPSWTPPKAIDNSQALRNENLTVVLNNPNKKKKDKRRKSDRRGKDTDSRQKKRRHERERTPPPSKEVFASGDNILVSVSFNNENETRDVTTRDRRKKDAEDPSKKRKERRKNKNRRDLSGVKPVAIIDLERSPFKEITPSPKDIIVLSDSDNNDNEPVSRSVQKGICDSSQQVASPERSVNYSMGPKTPPEPQVKFSLNPKPPQVRAINNPLHEPDDMEQNDDVQEDINSRINEGLHKGPNTPPEPPNSPPSSPDAYDPFEPTKSRSPTPDPMQTTQLLTTSMGLSESNIDNIDSRAAIDLLEKSINPPSEVIKSLTPPIADIQPADSQSSIQVTPESNLGKSPERIGVIINQTVQPSLSTSKPVAQTTPFSSVPTSMITSTPVSSNLAPSRINILNSTIITPPHVASSIPQRIVLPNIVKSSPVKIPPTKAAIKSTPIKPMPNKNNKSTTRKSRNQNGSGIDDIILDFDSPYSPGSSDYEDLFEPPSENIIKSSTKSKTNVKSPQKHQSMFDALFGSPTFNKSKNKLDKNKYGKKTITPTKTKTVGVKLDEDNLKILDELPNSAVEMQVKDKFLKKLNRQERVVEEVKLVLKPHYNKKRINKEEYKDILRRSVPKICHNKSGEINPTKIKNLIEAYVKKIRHSKKVTSSSSVNPQKV